MRPTEPALTAAQRLLIRTNLTVAGIHPLQLEGVLDAHWTAATTRHLPSIQMSCSPPLTSCTLRCCVRDPQSCALRAKPSTWQLAWTDQRGTYTSGLHFSFERTSMQSRPPQSWLFSSWGYKSVCSLFSNMDNEIWTAWNYTYNEH